MRSYAVTATHISLPPRSRSQARWSVCGRRAGTIAPNSCNENDPKKDGLAQNGGKTGDQDVGGLRSLYNDPRVGPHHDLRSQYAELEPSSRMSTFASRSSGIATNAAAPQRIQQSST